MGGCKELGGDGLEACKASCGPACSHSDEINLQLLVVGEDTMG